MPIHPRSDLWPCLETKFHVTNNGYSSSAEEGGSVPESSSGVVTFVEFDRIERDEAADNVVVLDESDDVSCCKRDIEGNLIDFERLVFLSDFSSVSSSSLSSARLLRDDEKNQYCMSPNVRSGMRLPTPCLPRWIAA